MSSNIINEAQNAESINQSKIDKEMKEIQEMDDLWFRCN